MGMSGQAGFGCVVVMALSAWAATAAEEPLDFEIQLDVPLREFDGTFCWFHPRAGVIPQAGRDGAPAVVMTMQKWFLSASDFFSVLSDMRTDDLGASWIGPTERETLGWRETGENAVEGICDFTPGWHAPSGRLLAFGHTVRYVNDRLAPEPRQRSVAYSVYDHAARAWAPWKAVELPEGDKFFSAGAGCSQWITESDGTMLVPVYFKPRSDDRAACYSSTVMRFAFDGETVTYLEHGSELTVPQPRGLGETSITWFDGRYYLTMRNDERGYVAVGEDGLHFDTPVAWRFDDGQELGSYNTQQHWATHSDGLYLVYTRRGADNDHIVRHRAPLFIGRVDTGTLRVIRDTERVVIPKRGAMLGNFGVVTVNERETWVTVGEGMYRAEQITEGADGSVFAGRLRWSRPNRLAYQGTGRRIP